MDTLNRITEQSLASQWSTIAEQQLCILDQTTVTDTEWSCQVGISCDSGGVLHRTCGGFRSTSSITVIESRIRSQSAVKGQLTWLWQARTDDIQQIVVGAKQLREQLFQDLQMQTASFEELQSEVQDSMRPQPESGLMELMCPDSPLSTEVLQVAKLTTPEWNSEGARNCRGSCDRALARDSTHQHTLPLTDSTGHQGHGATCKASKVIETTSLRGVGASEEQAQTFAEEKAEEV
eukprot:3620766-Rhodomonas_salina.2